MSYVLPREWIVCLYQWRVVWPSSPAALYVTPCRLAVILVGLSYTPVFWCNTSKLILSKWIHFTFSTKSSKCPRSGELWDYIGYKFYGFWTGKINETPRGSFKKNWRKMWLNRYYENAALIDQSLWSKHLKLYYTRNQSKELTCSNPVNWFKSTIH